MEYLEKGCVSPINNINNKNEYDVLLKYLHQFFEGLYYLHNVGKIAHMDIKPDNIMLDQNNNIKIVDFGISQMIDTDANTITRLDDSNTINITQVTSNKKKFEGTKNFMAPEFENNNSNDNELLSYELNDIYAMGITFYYLATKNFPNFDSFNNPIFPSDFPLELKDLLIKCLKHNSLERPNTLSLINHNIFKSIKNDIIKNNSNIQIIINDYDIKHAIIRKIENNIFAISRFKANILKNKHN